MAQRREWVQELRDGVELKNGEVIPATTRKRELPATTVELRKIVLEEMMMMRDGTSSPTRLRAVAFAASTVLASVMTDIAHQKHFGSTKVDGGGVPLLGADSSKKDGTPSTDR